MPKAVRDSMPSVRAIIDCTEIAVERPSVTSNDVLTYSDYKSRDTFKVLLSIAPHGETTFLS